MRVVFFGTPAFAVPSLDALLDAGVEVTAVVTQPDRPRGRSHSTLTAPPVKQRALASGIPVLQPERPRGVEFDAQIHALHADLGVVVAYGHLLPRGLIAIPRLGMINVHASLLPRWRGAAPIHWALLSGDSETGVAIMRVEAGLDTGAVWDVERAPIGEQDTTGMLTERLARSGAQLLVRTLSRITGGDAPAEQPSEGVTIAPKIDRATARIRWDEAALAVSRRMRAMDPAPGAWTTLAGSDMKMFAPRIVAAGTVEAAGMPGSVVESSPRLVVRTGDGGAIEIGEVQPAGKRRLPAADWLRGAARLEGTQFA